MLYEVITEELYICYKSIGEYFDKLNTKIVSKYIGEYATSMEMAGMSITVMKLDDQLKDRITSYNVCYTKLLRVLQIYICRYVYSRRRFQCTGDGYPGRTGYADRPDNRCCYGKYDYRIL